MGKLEKIASQWVADGLYSSIDEAEQAMQSVLEEHEQFRRLRARIEADLKEGIAQLESGDTVTYDSVEDAFADILGEDWAGRDE